MCLHQAGPYLVSQRIKGGAALQNVDGGQWACTAMGIDVGVNISLCGGRRGVDSVVFSVWRW